ncbi:MAG: YraN family protein, partial [Spirochaetaceae bacterium]|nr:YraN family protein [Spirochaetaceae bacterium]
TLGKLTEEMVAAKVLKLFQNLGYEVGKAGRNIRFYKGSKRLAEIDIFLENGEVVVAVEVKTSLTVRDVNVHKERISRIREYMDERGDKRKIIGAAAGGVVPDDVREYAQQQGFYVLVQSGESICLAETAPGFEVKQW